MQLAICIRFVAKIDQSNSVNIKGLSVWYLTHAFHILKPTEVLQILAFHVNK